GGRLEGVPGDLEPQGEDPLVAGQGLEEGGVVPARPGDLDDGALRPVGGGELAEVLDAIDQASQEAAVPPGRPAGAGHAVLGVPAAAVDLPGGLDLVAELVAPGGRRL